MKSRGENRSLANVWFEPTVRIPAWGGAMLLLLGPAPDEKPRYFAPLDG
jgi:hypothetical protein